MGNLANVSERGFIISDIDLKFVGERAVANFAVAFNKDKKNEQTGQWDRDKGSVIRCAAWGPLGEFVAEHFSKQTEIDITGSLFVREYEKDGQTKQSVEMTVKTVGGPIPQRNSGGNDGGWGNA